ncbi:hypothetical protein PHMEG_00012973 [Phytophthora megakarya]|uniref:Reverse transcriptase RNase H-like domain-containing protein n=1 Tax=Phytophthora megakarya TaxID=4795 RepID=A0A225W7W7_9STRA|nr:hypothetical protein PHMEG_00012973 [Phytophthora megakarya]
MFVRTGHEYTYEKLFRTAANYAQLFFKRQLNPGPECLLGEHVRTLEKMGFVRRNNISRLACVVVANTWLNSCHYVKTARLNEFRLTIEYRPVNALTVPITDAGAGMTSSSENVDGAYGFAGFDMPCGFSQLPLDDDSHEIMSFITDDGVWTPCRVQQEAADSPLHFQNQMNVAFADMLYSELLIWIDDILLYSRTSRDFVGKLSGVAASLVVQALAMTLNGSVDFSRVMLPLYHKLEKVLKVVGERRGWELELLSRGFDATTTRRNFIEKDAFPIIWAARNFTYLLVQTSEFRLYCDHKNLVYVFAPDQEIEHIDRQTNLWADLLTRCGLPSEEGGRVIKCMAVPRSRVCETSTADKQMQRLHLRAGGFVFPTLTEIQAAQRKHAGLAPSSAQRNTEGTPIVAERMWVPEAEVAPLQRILIAAHSGRQGHRGIEPMVTTVTELFEVANLANVCRHFLSKCLLCKHVKGCNIIPRPWGPTYDAKERNKPYTSTTCTWGTTWARSNMCWV